LMMGDTNGTTVTTQLDRSGTAPNVPTLVLTNTNSDGLQSQVGGSLAYGVWGNNSAGYGVVGTSNASTGVSGGSASGNGVSGDSNGGTGVAGFSDTGAGVAGQSLAANSSYPGVSGISTGGVGVSGSSTGNHGVSGVTTATGTSFAGVYGSSTAGNGVYGQSTATSGTVAAVYGLSLSRSGVLGVSVDLYGVWGASTNQSGGYFQSVSNNGVTAISTSQAGVAGNSTSGHGLVGYSSSGAGVYGNSTSGYSGRFEGGQGVLINGHLVVQGGLDVYGLGNWKGAVVPHPDGSARRLCAVESPESWFEDFGSGTLVGGRATVALDPEFAPLVATDTYRVFLTPEGDCKGLYVSSKTPTGFEVRELQGGTSGVTFSYRILARRKDLVGLRLEKVAPPPAALPPISPPVAPPLPPLPAELTSTGGGRLGPATSPTPAAPTAPVAPPPPVQAPSRDPRRGR